MNRMKKPVILAGATAALLCADVAPHAPLGLGGGDSNVEALGLGQRGDHCPHGVEHLERRERRV